MPSRIYLLNPVNSAVRRYVPGLSSGNSKFPRLLVTAERATPVLMLVIPSLAPGTTAPEESFTVPVMVPVGLCARTADVRIAARSKETNSEKARAMCMAASSG